MSNPAPLSRTKNARRSPFSVTPMSIRGSATRRRELPRVGQEVVDHGAGEPGSASACRPSATATVTRWPAVVGAELANRRARQLGQVDRLALDLGAGDPGQRQQRVDQARHLARVGQDVAQPLAASASNLSP